MLRENYIYKRLIANKGFRNFGWLAADKGLRLLITVLVGSWVARYLGTSEFGTLAYAIAWISIVNMVANLGMDALVVRDIIQCPDRAGELVGSMMMVRMTAATLGTLIVVVFTYVIDPTSWHLLTILGAGVIIQSLEGGEIWFQSSIIMRKLVPPRLAVFLIVSGIKILLVAHGFGLKSFVILTAIEYAAGGLVTLSMLLWSKKGIRGLTASLEQARRLVVECWPLAISSLVVTLYMKTTPLLLGNLQDKSALGIYTAASRLTESINPVPMFMASSILPSLLQTRNQGERIYRRARLRYYRLSALASYAVCVPMAISSDFIVELLYGHQYRDAAGVLAIHTWSLVFVFIGVARAQIFLNERDIWSSLRFTVWGLMANVILSFLMIPEYGVIGAAWAVLVSYGLSALVSSFFRKRTREAGWEQLKGLSTPWLAFERIGGFKNKYE